MTGHSSRIGCCSAAGTQRRPPSMWSLKSWCSELCSPFTCGDARDTQVNSSRVSARLLRTETWTHTCAATESGSALPDPRSFVRRVPGAAHHPLAAQGPRAQTPFRAAGRTSRHRIITPNWAVDTRDGLLSLRFHTSKSTSGMPRRAAVRDLQPPVPGRRRRLRTLPRHQHPHQPIGHVARCRRRLR